MNIPDIQLTEHFWLSEFVNSSTAVRLGINNDPLPGEIEEIRKTAQYLEEQVRPVLGNLPIKIDSGIRCAQLNRAVRGAPDSDHLWGGAADIICPAFGTPFEIATKLVATLDKNSFGQIIFEGSWTHIARIRQDRKYVGSVLTAVFDSQGRATYKSGIINHV